MKSLENSNDLQDIYSLPQGAKLSVSKFKINGLMVEKTSNLREFGVELHLNNGVFTGSISDHLELHNQIQHILDTYKER